MTAIAMGKTIRSAAAALLLGGLGLGGAAGDAAADPVLVELYTSQGCYLCPAADDFLGELSERDDVVGLSLNVDYWDYIGWEDTLALPGNKLRQTAYAAEHNESAIGTPHMIVNGMNAMPGGKKGAIMGSINQAAEQTSPATVTLAREGRSLTVTVTPSAGASAGGSVMIAPYRQSVTETITAGENDGETLTYHNAILSLEPLGGYNGRATTLTAALPSEADGVAVWVQRVTAQGPVGEILGVAKAEW